MAFRAMTVCLVAWRSQRPSRNPVVAVASDYPTPIGAFLCVSKDPRVGTWRGSILQRDEVALGTLVFGGPLACVRLRNTVVVAAVYGLVLCVGR